MFNLVRSLNHPLHRVPCHPLSTNLNCESKHLVCCAHKLKQPIVSVSLRSFSRKVSRMNEKDIRNLARSFAKWQPTTDRPVIVQPNETQWKIMTYNILAQCNLVAHPELYKTCNPDHLEWSYRSSRIVNEILSQNCDIVCLQEVQEDHFLNDLQPALTQNGYLNVFKGKTGDKNEGCAVFWKKDRVNLLKFEPVELYLPRCNVLNRHNVGLVLIFSSGENPRAKLCVANTHLLFNNRRGEVRLAQLRYLMATIERVAFLKAANNAPVYLPIVMCGDFNTPPFCPFYQFILNCQLKTYGLKHSEIIGNTGGARYLEPREVHVGEILPCTLFEDEFISRYGIEALTSLSSAYEENFIYHSLGPFSSCYTHTKNNAPEVSNYADEAFTSDYIFFRSSKLLRCVERLSLMNQSELDRLGGLPNAYQCSDHLPLAAKFHLKPIPEYIHR